MIGEQPSGFDPSRGSPRPAHDHAATAFPLQNLATEHGSRLSTRSFTYTELCSRVSMFLTVLTGAVVSLAPISQADRFGTTFVLISILVLSVVVFFGVATIVRLAGLNRDDMRWVIGMNRIRHAYLELHPELEPYFVTGQHDDIRGIFLTLGLDSLPNRSRLMVLHGVQTLPGMLSVVVSVVAGALGALVVVAVTGSPEPAVAAAIVGFLLSVVAFYFWGTRTVRYRTVLEPRFPQPPVAEKPTPAPAPPR